MIEIEVKAKLKDRESVISKLKELGCVFEDPMTQEDSVYVENLGTAETFRTANKIFLRLRIKNGKKVIFTAKRREINDLVATEHELEVGSKEPMEQILSLLGYKQAVQINKTRVITHYNNCEICIDEVAGLGVFIEMESLVEEGNPEFIQKELFNFFISLGIRPEDRETVGYDILMMRKLEMS
jgi:adenylate cyclase class 2